MIAENHRGALFVISGPSGVGKGTLASRLCECLPDVWLSVSMTTRQPRDGEVDGVQYSFVSTERFCQTIEADGFIEWAKVHSNYYGTPSAPIETHLAAGEDVVLEIDVQGGLQVRDKFPEAILIFIAPPDMETLEKRLRTRATDSEESIVQRLADAHSELQTAAQYDVTIVNDDLERTTKELVEVVKCRAGRD